MFNLILISEWQIDKVAQVKEHFNVFVTNLGQDKKEYKHFEDFKAAPPQKWEAFRLGSIYLFPEEYGANTFVIIDNRNKLDSILALISEELQFDLLSIVNRSSKKQVDTTIKSTKELNTMLMLINFMAIMSILFFIRRIYHVRVINKKIKLKYF